MQISDLIRKHIRIDSHVHIAKHHGKMTTADIIYGMKKYNIDHCVISCCDCIEYDSKQRLIPMHKQVSQYDANMYAIKEARKHPCKLSVLMWAKPNLESCDQQFRQLCLDSRDVVVGLKFHPFHSNLPFDSDKIRPYLDFANKNKLTVVTHTAADINSQPRLVYKVARKYPNVKFVMVHMGLNTDNLAAMDYIRKLPNLYGDTTWVNPESMEMALHLCGGAKIMFGSDSPIDGRNTYKHEYYQFLFDKFKSIASSYDYNLIMGETAQKVFHI